MRNTGAKKYFLPNEGVIQKTHAIMSYDSRSEGGPDFVQKKVAHSAGNEASRIAEKTTFSWFYIYFSSFCEFFCAVLLETVGTNRTGQPKELLI